MPYRVEGNRVLVERNGRWVVAYVHRNHAQALAQLRALSANVPEARRARPPAPRRRR